MRLLAAHAAAEAEGGDLRGRQSAAILVVPAQGNNWETVVSLRVEDHPHPLVELRRLVELHRAYVIAEEADELVNEGRYEEASRLYVKASDSAPDNQEIRFWAGLGAAHLGDMDTAVRDVEAAIAAHPGWRTLLDRLPPEVAPQASAVRQRLSSDRSARPG
jgi:hypothetical protein